MGFVVDSGLVFFVIGCEDASRVGFMGVSGVECVVGEKKEE